MNPPLPVVKPSMPPYEEYIEEIQSLWETRWLTHTGPKHEKLRSELAAYLEVKDVALFANGHLALELALDALNLEGEVITTPYTFASSTQAIVRNGLVPVFCDIDPETYTIDPEQIESLITPRTSAILPVHVYGNICDMDAIEALARRHGLKVIYDAAHAFGIKVKGRAIGTYGDISMFSFHATKVFHTVEGGGLTFQDPTLASVFAKLRQFGMEGQESVVAIGTNAKMTEAHAAMGLCNLKHIGEYIELRGLAVARYRQSLSDVPGLKLCQPQPGVSANNAYFPVLIDEEQFGMNRDELADRLAAENIFVRKYFYPLTSSFKAYQGRFPLQETPIAARIASNILTLPLYSDLCVEDVDRICRAILEHSVVRR